MSFYHTLQKKKKFSHPFTLLPFRPTLDSSSPRDGFLLGPLLKLETILCVLFDCSRDSVSHNPGWPQICF